MINKIDPQFVGIFTPQEKIDSQITGEKQSIHSSWGLFSYGSVSYRGKNRSPVSGDFFLQEKKILQSLGDFYPQDKIDSQLRKIFQRGKITVLGDFFPTGLGNFFHGKSRSPVYGDFFYSQFLLIFSYWKKSNPSFGIFLQGKKSILFSGDFSHGKFDLRLFF